MKGNPPFKLRLPERCQPYWDASGVPFCYEDGDGDLIYSPNPFHRDKMYLLCKEDSETGERYLCMAQQGSCKL